MNSADRVAGSGRIEIHFLCRDIARCRCAIGIGRGNVEVDAVLHLHCAIVDDVDVDGLFGETQIEAALLSAAGARVREIGGVALILESDVILAAKVL